MGRSILSQTHPDPLDDEICIKNLSLLLNVAGGPAL